jgi:hypothetical protein
VIRLLKAWNKQYNQPGFSSHNLTVWAWEFIEVGMGMATALSTVLTEAADRVPLENSVSRSDLGFCCEISPVAETISRCCYRSSIAC